jgi:hypothetical protein
MESTQLSHSSLSCDAANTGSFSAASSFLAASRSARANSVLKW